MIILQDSGQATSIKITEYIIALVFIAAFLVFIWYLNMPLRKHK